MPIIRIDNQKLKDLGWMPCITVEDGFRRTIQYIEASKYEADND